VSAPQHSGGREISGHLLRVSWLSRGPDKEFLQSLINTTHLGEALAPRESHSPMPEMIATLLRELGASFQNIGRIIPLVLSLK
jgi:hypothetical protein